MSEFTPPPQYAQYPRDQFQPSSEFDRPPGVYLDALGDAWTIVKRDVGTWIAMFLVTILIVVIISIPFSVLNMLITGGGSLVPQQQPTMDAKWWGSSMLFNILTGAISMPVYGGLMYVALKHIRGEGTEFADVFKGLSFFLPLAIFGALSYFLIFVGALLCIIPVFFVIGIITPGILLVMDRGLGPVEAITESMRVLGGKAWLLGLFVFLVYLLMSIIGVLACCIGWLVTMPIVVVFGALHYHYFWPRQVAETTL